MLIDDNVRIQYLGSNPSSDTPILSLILISIVVNSVVFYFLQSSMSPHIKSYIVGTIHACISVLSVCLYFMLTPVDLTQVNKILGGGIKGTNDEIVTYFLCYSAGYFIYDTIIKFRYNLIRNSSEWIHHIVHILSVVSGLYTRVGHLNHFFLHFGELSTIPLSLAVIFSARPRIKYLFNLLFAITFILCRLIYGIIICIYVTMAVPKFIQMTLNAGDTISFIFILIQVILYILTLILNFYWSTWIAKKVWSTIQNKKID